METLRYEVHFDGQVHQQVVKAHYRKLRGATAKNTLTYGLYYAVIGMLIYYVAGFEARRDGPWAGAIATGILWLLYMVVATFVQVQSVVDNAPKAHAGYEWVCEINDEAWSFEKPSGYKVVIPWKTMKWRYETPGAFIISVEDQEIYVYREPLQRAGLEAEFLRRLRGEQPA